MKLIPICVLFLGAALACPTSATAQELEEVLSTSAYRTRAEATSEADKRFVRAMMILNSKFTDGTVREFQSEINKAGILGHPDAAYVLCSMNSNPKLGIAFFQEAYFWCQAARFYFSSTNPETAKAAEQKFAFVSERLGPNNIALGQDHQEYMLQKMRSAAR